MGHHHRLTTLKAVLFALALLLVPAAATAAADAGGADQDKLSLGLKLEKGQVYPLRATVDQVITQTAQGRRQQVKQKIGIGYVMSVQAVDAEGNATLGVEYNAVRLSMQAPTGNVEYDSEDPPEQVHPAAVGLTAIVGQQFTLKLTPTGKVLEVKGLDKLVDAVMKKLNVPPGADAAGVKKMMTDQFGEETVREQMGQMFSFYPDNPVAVGESWKRTVTLTKGFPMVLESTYTLKGRAGGVADIAVTSKIKSNPDAKPVQLGAARMSYDLAGGQSGTLKVDEASGLGRSSQLNQDLSGTMTVQVVGAPQAVSIPVQIKSSLSIEPTEAKPAKTTEPADDDQGKDKDADAGATDEGKDEAGRK